MDKRKRPVVKVDKVTGRIVEEYESARAAASANGVTLNSLYPKVRYKNLFGSGRFFFRFADEYDPFENWTGKSGRPIIAMNKKLKEVRHFINAEEAADFLGISVAAVYGDVTKGFKSGGWQIRWQASPSDWSNVQAKWEKLCNSNS